MHIQFFYNVLHYFVIIIIEHDINKFFILLQTIVIITLILACMTVLCNYAIIIHNCMHAHALLVLTSSHCDSVVVLMRKSVLVSQCL